MSPKCKADFSDGNASKKRETTSMEVKDVIIRLERGKTLTNISRLLDLSYATVSIIGDKKRILEHVKEYAPYEINCDYKAA